MSAVPPDSAPARDLVPLAWANALVHAVGLACAVRWMAPGIPPVSLVERRAYLAHDAVAWSWSWGVWMVCALAFLAFAAALAQHLRAPGTLSRLSLALAQIAVAVDLSCDTLYAAALPMAARASSEAEFLVLERAVSLASIVVANGAYVLSVAAMAAHLRARGLASTGASASALVTTVSGLGMCAAAFADRPALMPLLTAPTILGFSLWAILVARDLERAPTP